MSRLQQQREYMQILNAAYGKVLRLCGAGSNQEIALLDVLIQEKAKLARLEADNE
jgi:hypothetical protein